MTINPYHKHLQEYLSFYFRYTSKSASYLKGKKSVHKEEGKHLRKH